MPPLARKTIDLEGPISPGPGTIKNRETGAELHGKVTLSSDMDGRFYFAIDGATGSNTFFRKDWTFTPDPEPVKDGYYLRSGMIYRINGEQVNLVNMQLPGDQVIESANRPRRIAEEGVFLGDLEGNR